MQSIQMRRSKTQIAACGDDIYNRTIRADVDNANNNGKLVLIDVETGSWEMDADEVIASRRLRERLPNAEVWVVRVGLPYVHRLAAGRGRVLS